jgi:PAS domain S-box-containing protein
MPITGSTVNRSTLAQFIRSQRDTILRHWEVRVRALSPASKLSHDELRDHLPHLIERVADLAERLEEHDQLPVDEAELHAVDRLQDGYDLPDVIREYSLLRDILIDAAAEAGVPGVDELRVLNRVLDHATNVSVSRFAQASQRLLKALDRISTEALAARPNVPDLLDRLLHVIVEASPAVDAAAILLREDNRLRVRAAVGIIAHDGESSVAMGQGFAGAIAQERKPRLVRNAAEDPQIEMEAVRHAGIRALYGVPLVESDVIGVAYMASRSAFEFSDEDMLLFRAMANRAGAHIVEARLREDIERRSAELEAVLESIPDGVHVGDASGVKRANRPGCALLGFSRHEELNRPIAELVQQVRMRSAATGEALPLEEQPFMRALQGDTIEREVLIRRVDTGEDRCLRSIAAPLRLHDAIIGAVAVHADITERKAIEEELRKGAEYRERFIGVLSHDLRSPVSAINLSLTLLLEQEGLTPVMTRVLKRVLTTTARIEGMIRDLLDFSRARQGSVPLNRAPMDLEAAVRQVADELALAHPDRVVELVAEGDTRGVWDAGRVAQMISNLVSNAILYSPAETAVAVRVRGGEEVVSLEVANQGEPLDASVKKHLFDPFRRGSASEHRHAEGLGLGLFITKSIVDAHGGQISVVSAAGAGTSITVTLPRRPL